MRGVFFLGLKEMVVHKIGGDIWKEALIKAGISNDYSILPISDVDDSSIINIIKALCSVLDISLVQLADAFGDYWINIYTQKIYPVYYLDAKTAKEFLLKMDSVHVNSTKNMINHIPPRFEYEWKDEKTLIITYKSKRGLIYFAVGLIKGVGKFYKENLKVIKLGDDKIEVIFQ